GSRHWVGENPPEGTAIYFNLAAKADKLNLKVVDYAGKTVIELPVKNEPGLQRVQWNLMRFTPRPLAPGALFDVTDQRPRLFSQPVVPGMYRVVLTVNGEESSQPLRIEADPSGATTLRAEDVGDEEEKEKKEEKRRKIDD